jgi:UMP-CMP kinase
MHLGPSSRSNKYYPWIYRRGGNQSFSRNQSLRSTASTLKESSNSVGESGEIEKRAIESLSIASGGTAPTELKSFGGLTYRDSSLSKLSSLFRVVFILGGPGAGKGTQCDLLIQNYPCHHLSAGQLLRDEAEKKDGSSEHATLIAECLVAGKIVPVEISLALLQNAMREVEGNDSLIFLIDGFPRNFDNLEGWTRCMTRDDDKSSSDAAAVLGVLSYDCPLSILEERVMQRSKDSGRSDDNLESLRRRFKTFQSETVPVVDTLKVIDQKTSSLLKVVEIEGQKSLEEVWEETQKSVNSFIGNDVLSANMRLLEAIAKKDVDAYRSLCADEMFSEENNENNVDEASVMEAQETEEDDSFLNINVKCAEMTFITGKKISVSYDRTSDSGITFRETRVWSHQGPKGWRMVHFYRGE